MAASVACPAEDARTGTLPGSGSFTSVAAALLFMAGGSSWLARSGDAGGEGDMLARSVSFYVAVVHFGEENRKEAFFVC